MGEVVVGISGASGAVYGKRLVEVLTDMGKSVRLVVTDSGRLTLKHECDTTPEALAEATGSLLEDARNVGAKSASGSAKIDAVVICPCSGTTIGKLAAGISDNLVTRSAIVAMKSAVNSSLFPEKHPTLQYIWKTWPNSQHGIQSSFQPLLDSIIIQKVLMIWLTSSSQESLTKLALNTMLASVGLATKYESASYRRLLEQGMRGTVEAEP